MYVGADFSPIDASENILEGIDFVNDLPEGNTVASCVVTCENAPNTAVIDPSPSSRITAGPFVSGTQVSVRLATCIANVTYRLIFVATTNAGDVYTLYSNIYCESVT